MEITSLTVALIAGLSKVALSANELIEREIEIEVDGPCGALWLFEIQLS